jgi:hypothetical protein
MPSWGPRVEDVGGRYRIDKIQERWRFGDRQGLFDDLDGPARPIDDDQLAVPQHSCADVGSND